MEKIQTVVDFIRERFPLSFRENTEDKDTLLGLPFPYVVPCVKGHFQELYYWDTYFACRGLILCGYEDMVKHNCDNFIHEINRFGYIPNGSRTSYLNRSQPPFFGMLIELNRQLNPTAQWVKEAMEALEKEYEFWMTKRAFDNGLNHYGDHGDEKLYQEFYDGVCLRRIKLQPIADPAKQLKFGKDSVAEAESGWDFNPRFDCRCGEFAPIDLNSLLYKDELILAEYFTSVNDEKKAEFYEKQAQKRLDLLNSLCFDPQRGVFLDYDMVNQRRSSVFSVASLYPLWVGLASEAQAASTVKEFEKCLELPALVVSCEKNSTPYTFQWDYPNAWPPLQLVAMEAMDSYGYYEIAERLARKYVSTVVREFEKSGDLWEKYNAVDGSTAVKSEYGTPAMLGWTAGVFLVACKRINADGKIKLNSK